MVDKCRGMKKDTEVKTWCVCMCVKQSEQSDNKVNRYRSMGSQWRR